VVGVEAVHGPAVVVEGQPVLEGVMAVLVDEAALVVVEAVVYRATFLAVGHRTNRRLKIERPGIEALGALTEA
jgi:hypothetical protein